MNHSGKKWIVRDSIGRITGPFPTEKILYKIGRGELNGDESIAFYPGGLWIAITQDPQFYDKLLDSLTHEDPNVTSQTKEVFEGSANQATQLASQRKVGSAPPELPPPPLDNPESSDAPSMDEVTVIHRDTSKEPKKKRKKKKQRLDVIELIDVKKQFNKEILKRALLPIAVIAIGAFALMEFRSSPVEEGDRIHLLAPQKNQPALSVEALSERSQEGLQGFLQDTYSGYLQAQNNL